MSVIDRLRNEARVFKKSNADSNAEESDDAAMEEDYAVKREVARPVATRETSKDRMTRFRTAPGSG